MIVVFLLLAAILSWEMACVFGDDFNVVYINRFSWCGMVLVFFCICNIGIIFLSAGEPT